MIFQEYAGPQTESQPRMDFPPAHACPVVRTGHILHRADSPGSNLAPGHSGEIHRLLRLSDRRLRDGFGAPGGLRPARQATARIRPRTAGLHRASIHRTGAEPYAHWNWVPATEAETSDDTAESVWSPLTASPEHLQQEYLFGVLDGAARKDTKRLEHLMVRWCSTLAAGMGAAWTAADLLRDPFPDALWAWLGPYWMAVAAGLYLTSCCLQRRWYADSGLPDIPRPRPSVIQPPGIAPLVPEPIAVRGRNAKPHIHGRSLRLDARSGLWLPHQPAVTHQASCAAPRLAVNSPEWR